MDVALVPILGVVVLVGIVVVIVAVLNGNRGGGDTSGSHAASVYPGYTDSGHGHSHDGGGQGNDGGGFGGDGGGGGGGT